MRRVTRCALQLLRVRSWSQAQGPASLAIQSARVRERPHIRVLSMSSITFSLYSHGQSILDSMFTMRRFSRASATQRRGKQIDNGQ